jgi:4-diphosphocytidyl-2-C-methyl-D-erythritol kinase
MKHGWDGAGLQPAPPRNWFRKNLLATMKYRRIVLRSYAKVNLGLHVLGKREDGYHELRTVFQTIRFHDRLEIELTRRQGIEFRTNCPQLEVGDNLVVKAAEALARHRGLIFLDKRIPLGGGLGGGSSNAAVALLGLNQVLNLHLSPADLFEIGGGLGSDICFFFLGGTALGVGRGSEVYPLEEPAARPLLLVVPPFPVSTLNAYGRLSLALTKRVNESMISVFCPGCLDHLYQGKLIGNDFEQVVFQDFPRLKQLQQELLRVGALDAGLTGSGSVVFGVFNSRQELEKAQAKIRLRQWQLIPTRMLTRKQYRASLVESLQ